MTTYNELKTAGLARRNVLEVATDLAQHMLLCALGSPRIAPKVDKDDQRDDDEDAQTPLNG